MTRVAAHLVRQLTAVLAEARPDGQLLTAFVTNRDESAFAEIVRRHGPLVWGVCRRLLPDPADAEDAFQAVFLVLVRRVHQLTGRTEIGPWLYRVAVWTGRSLRRRNARQFARRETLSPETPDPAPGPEAIDLRADLDRALLALPQKYRDPLILCHLQGWSRREAAARLGCPEGTLSSLLARGLDRLRVYLRDRNPTPALVAAGTAVPAALTAATVRAAVAAPLATAGVISSTIHQLAEGVLHMLWVKKATAATFALVVVFGFGVGIGVSVRDVPRATAEDDKPAPERGKTTARALTRGEDVERMLEDRTAELAEHEAALQAARERVGLAREKLELIEEAVERGFASNESLKEARTAAKRAEDEVAKLEKIQAKLAAQIKERAARGKPAPPAAAELEKLERRYADKYVDALAAQLEGLKAEQAALEAAARKLSREREQIQLKMAELKKRQAEAAAKEQVAREGLAVPVEKLSLEVRVGTKDAAWPFLVKEYGPDGRPIGSVACENAEVLARLLARVAKDPSGPKGVLIAANPGTANELVQSVLDTCRKAGLMGVVLTKPGVSMKVPGRSVEEDDARKRRPDEKQPVDEEQLMKKRLDERRHELEKIERLRELEDALKMQTEKLDRLRRDQMKPALPPGEKPAPPTKPKEPVPPLPPAEKPGKP